MPPFDRRQFLHSAAPVLLLGAASPGPPARKAATPAAGKEKEEEDVSPAEDLMREHGVLKRVLLVYDEVRRRIAARADFPPEVVTGGAQIIRTFIEEYHEDEQHRKFGRDGFEGVVEKVAALEKTLGTYDLAQFTPR